MHAPTSIVRTSGTVVLSNEPAHFTSRTMAGAIGRDSGSERMRAKKSLRGAHKKIYEQQESR